MHIKEAKKYIGLLRTSKVATQMQMEDAEEQIDSDGIPDITLFDDEDDHNSSSDFHPPSRYIFPTPTSDLQSTGSGSKTHSSDNVHCARSTTNHLVDPMSTITY